MRSLLSWGNSIEIELVEEGGDSFKKMSNSEKYYFHNWNVFGMIEERFSEYDYFIKLRPDLELHTLNNQFLNELGKIRSGSILSDAESYFFRPWGFGMGDQMFAGRSKLAFSLLRPFDRWSDLERLLRASGRVKYSLHTTIGMSAWLGGLLHSPFKRYSRKGLAVMKKIREGDEE